MNRSSTDSNGDIIRIENGTFRWSDSCDDPLILRKYNKKEKENRNLIISSVSFFLV